MSACDRVAAAYARIRDVERPEVWISLRREDDTRLDAERIDARVAAGEHLPLAGYTLAVKDNIDVAGLPTTAGCPLFAYIPDLDAPAVGRLTEAGAVVLGKTNLDQFATGLVGTRSPYGAVRDTRRPDRISGGSSSGSAVAVALGIADLAVGTDTAGSGRVPASFQGLYGLKPTRGLVPTTGVVPACRSLDCVTVFARDLCLAEQALWLMAGPDRGDPLSQPWPASAALAAPTTATVAVPSRALPGLTQAAAASFAATIDRLRAAGVTVVEVEIEPYLEAGRMLYDGAFVAERHAAVGAFVEANLDAVDPTVGAIITAAGSPTASALARDEARLCELATAVREGIFARADALLLPTTTSQPTIAEVAASPISANSQLGLYTNAANLLDLCVIAAPAGEADGGCFGVSLLAPRFSEHVILDIAARLTSCRRPAPMQGVPVLVVGAHRRGYALNHELTGRGSRFLETILTAAEYRLHALPTVPPKPGLVRTSGEDGVAIEGELWAVPVAGLAGLLAELPQPMTLGRVALCDGRQVVGFLCEPAVLDGSPDISSYQSWPRYLADSQ